MISNKIYHGTITDMMLNPKTKVQKSTYGMIHLYKVLEQTKLIYGDRNLVASKSVKG